MSSDNDKSVLAFMAHPDDAEICMGGTLARLADSGYNVHIVLASVPDNRDQRLAEAEAGARILGANFHLIDVVKNAATWQVEDVPLYRLVGAFDEVQRQILPSMIFTHWNGDTHYDHVLVSRATISATRRLSVDLFMCEQPNQYAPSATPMQLNTYVDVSRYMERRLKGINAHVSQTTNRAYDDHVLNRARYHGERIGCEYAEAFQCVVQRLKT